MFEINIYIFPFFKNHIFFNINVTCNALYIQYGQRNYGMEKNKTKPRLIDNI